MGPSVARKSLRGPKSMIVYLIRNKVNGKGYVGATQRTAEERWRAHRYESHGRALCRHLHSAMKEFGEDAFEISVLASVETLEELYKTERKFIVELGTLAPEGYNLNLGGGGGKGMCAESRARIADAHRIYRAPSKTPEEALFWARKASENFPRNVASKMRALVGALLGDGN